METQNRTEKGGLIFRAKGAIKRIINSKYVVISQSGNGNYEIQSTALGWVCSCQDHVYRGVKCKHIHAVEISFALRKQVMRFC
jgi:putative transposase